MSADIPTTEGAHTAVAQQLCSTPIVKSGQHIDAHVYAWQDACHFARGKLAEADATVVDADANNRTAARAALHAPDGYVRPLALCEQRTRRSGPCLLYTSPSPRD